MKKLILSAYLHIRLGMVSCSADTEGLENGIQDPNGLLNSKQNDRSLLKEADSIVAVAAKSQLLQG
jgi:hypothetical protein